MTNAITADDAIKAGGSLWNGTRVYFNNLLDIAQGIDVNFYGTGNVSSASVDGKGISNNKAQSIVSALRYGKVWFDIESGKFAGKGLDQELFSRCVAGIKAKIAA